MQLQKQHKIINNIYKFIAIKFDIYLKSILRYGISGNIFLLHCNLINSIIQISYIEFLRNIIHGCRLRTSVNARVFSGVYTKWYAGRLDVILPEKLCYNMIIFFQTFYVFENRHHPLQTILWCAWCVVLWFKYGI